MLIVKNARLKIERLKALGLKYWIPTLKKGGSKFAFPYKNLVFVESDELDDQKLYEILKSEGFFMGESKKDHPYSLNDEERSSVINYNKIEEPQFKVGVNVKVIDGLFKGNKGVITAISENSEKNKDDLSCTILLNAKTSSFNVELSVNQLELI